MKKEYRSAERLLGSLYAAAVWALLLRYLLLLFLFREPYASPLWIRVLQCSLAACGVVLGRMWRRKTFLVLAAYEAWMVLRLLFGPPASPDDADYVRQILLHGLWAFGACCSLPFVLDEARLKRFLRSLAAAWTAVFTVHCLLALYSAFSGVPVWNLPHGAFWGFSRTVGMGAPGYNAVNAVGRAAGARLQVILYCTVSGAVASLSGMIALCGAFCEKKRAYRALYLAALLPILFVLGLTDARAAHISFSAGAGTLAGIPLLRALRRGFRDRRPLPGPARWAAVLGAAAAVTLLGVLLLAAVPRVFSALSRRAAPLFSAAPAAAGAPSSRGYSGSPDTVLSGRLYIWRYVLRYLREHPLSLLTGESIRTPMRGPNAQDGLLLRVGHPHSAVLWILLQNGLPGLLAVLAVLWEAARGALRLLRRRELPPFLAAVPAVFLSLLTGDLAECISGLLGYPYPNCSFLLLCIGILCAAGAPGKGLTGALPPGSGPSGQSGKRPAGDPRIPE